MSQSGHSELKCENIFSPSYKPLLQSVLSVGRKWGLGAQAELQEENQQFLKDHFKQQMSEMPTWHAVLFHFLAPQ